MKTFENELRDLINRYSKENSCNTPDFILAGFMNSCLNSFAVAVCRRDIWWKDDLRHFNKAITKDPPPDHTTLSISAGKC